MTSSFSNAAAIREAALDYLRSATGAGGRSNAVRAQLEDDDIEGAWRDAEEGGCSPDLWRRLADARRGDHPDDALAVYRRLLEHALEHSNAGAYEEAIDLLGAIRASLVPTGRSSEFEAELERIRSEQRRRPKLISMLAAHGW